MLDNRAQASLDPNTFRGGASQEISQLLKFRPTRIAGTPRQTYRPANRLIDERAGGNQARKGVTSAQREHWQERISLAGGDHVPKCFQAGGMPGSRARLRLTQGECLITQTMALLQQQQIVPFQIFQLKSWQIPQMMTGGASQVKRLKK